MSTAVSQAAGSSHAHVQDGTGKVLAIISLALAVMASTVTICVCVFLRGEMASGFAAVEKRMMDRTASTEARLMDHSYLAKQEARVAQDDVQKLRIDFEIHKRGNK